MAIPHGYTTWLYQMAIPHGYTYQIKCYHCKMLIYTEHTFFAGLLDKVLQTSVKMSTKSLHKIFYLCQFCLFFKVCKWDALQSDLGCRSFICIYECTFYNLLCMFTLLPCNPCPRICRKNWDFEYILVLCFVLILSYKRSNLY